MSTRLVFEISFASDYHVGSGHGDGLVDSVLLRDGDGVPVIRGSTVVGLLRDALWQLLQQQPLAGQAKCRQSGLNDDNAPPYCAPDQDPCPICRIFGSPGQPKRWRFSSARPAKRSQPDLPQRGNPVGGQVVHRVRISPRTRRAEARKLFRLEHGEAAWRFSFTARTGEQDEGVSEEAALLVAAARAVRGLGRGRRRGRGACLIHLQDRDEEKIWLERFKSHWLEGMPLTVETDTVPVQVPDIEPAGKPCRLRLLVRLDEPVLLARRAEAGNEFESAALIPGTALLGALANRAARRYELDEEMAKEAFVQLFLRGRVRFSMLLPLHLDPEDILVPTIPAPLDMLTCKAFPGFTDCDDAHSVLGYALSTELPEHCPDCARRPPIEDKNVPVKPLSGFVKLQAEPRQFKPERSHEMHIRVDPTTGRVQHGDLYGYVSLEAGQYFIGEVVCADGTAWQALQEMAALPVLGNPFPLYLGKATRRGHGRVTVLLGNPQDLGPADPWRVLPLGERVPDDPLPEELVMTLLSDAILPDVWMRGRIGFSEQWLGDLLGAPIEIQHAFARSRPVDGFFGHLGLPRFRDIALVAGSAVGIHFPAGPPPDLLAILARLEEEGIGLRRAEGYGQVVFNHPLYDQRGALAENLLDWPQALQPPSQDEPIPMLVERFQKEWERVLDEVGPGVWKKERFEAIARLLRHGAGGTVTTLRERLQDDHFGQPRRLLGDNLGGPRKEKKSVRETKPGRKKIGDLLEKLEHHEFLREHADLAPQLRRLGIEMLADRVAQGAAAARAEKSARKEKTDE